VECNFRIRDFRHFWDITQRCLVVSCRRFGTTYRSDPRWSNIPRRRYCRSCV